MAVDNNDRVIDLTVDQLRQILREEVKRVLYSLDNDVCNIAAPSVKTIPIEKLSELTGWSKSCIYKKCSLRQIPHHKVGKELRFDMKEINDWIKSKKRKSGDELVTDFEARQKTLIKKTR